MTPDKFTALSADADLERLCHAVHDETGTTHAVSGEQSLSVPQVTAYCAEVFFGLTLNGGFQSLFAGAYQWTVPHTASSLRAVGLSEFADVMDNAVSNLFPNGIPTDEDEYDSAIDKLYDEFDESPLADQFEDPFEIHETRFWEVYQQDEIRFRTNIHRYLLENQYGFVSMDGGPAADGRTASE